MIDWNTYFRTHNFPGGSIIQQADPFDPLDAHTSDGFGLNDDDRTELSPGVQIGRIINAILLCGLLLYFCLVR